MEKKEKNTALTANSLFQKLFSLLHHVFLLLPPQILYFIFRLPKQRILIQTLFFIFLVIVFTLIAAVSYMIIYFWYIPPISHQKAIFFQYYNVHEEYGPFANSVIMDRNEPFLTAGQAYDVSLQLSLPESSVNAAMGNVMALIELKNFDNRTVIAESRSFLFSYRSLPVDFARKLLNLVPLLLGFMMESESIQIKVIEGVFDRSSDPITSVFVRLSNPYVQVYSASIKFDAHFKGLRYYMYYWFFTTAFLFVSFMISFQIILLILVSYWAGIGALFTGGRPKKVTIEADLGFETEPEPESERQEDDSRLDDESKTQEESTVTEMSDGYSSDVTITNTSASAYSDMIEVGRITESESESTTKEESIDFVMALEDVGIRQRKTAVNNKKDVNDYDDGNDEDDEDEDGQ